MTAIAPVSVINHYQINGWYLFGETLYILYLIDGLTDPILFMYIYLSLFRYMCLSIHTHTHTHTYIYIYIYEVHTTSFQTFFVWALLFILHTWNSSSLQNNLLRLQSTRFILPINSGRPHGSPLVWAYQWPLSQPLSSPQLSQNDSLWA